MACLERGRTALTAVASIVESADAQTLANVPLAMQAIPEPEGCSDLNALLSGVQQPTLAQLPKVREVRRGLDKARVQIAAGQYRQALALVQPSVGESRALGYRPLLAEVLLVAGHATLALDGRRAAAVPLLEEATTLAVQVGADALAVEAWARRAWAQATSSGEGSALDGLELVQALAERVPAARFERALLFNNVGGVELARERRGSAQAAFERALRESEGVTGPGAVELTNVAINLSLTTDDRTRRDVLLADAVARLTSLLGAEHPHTLQVRWMTASTQVSLARAAADLGSTCESLELQPSLSALTPRCWSELAFVRGELRDGPRALAAIERAWRARDPKADPSSGHEILPYLLFWQGSGAAAAKEFSEALTAIGPIASQAPWWSRFERAELELGRGRALLAVGALPAAQRALQGAVDALGPIANAHPTADHERRFGRATIELAKVMAQNDGNRAELAAVAARAVNYLREVGGSDAEMAEITVIVALSHR
jgi:tetratricopeptide (TPR) repeat protein